jgi:hypothetical protein
MQEEAIWTDPMVPRSISNTPVRVISSNEIGYADTVTGPEMPSNMVRVALLTGGIWEIALSDLREMSDGELLAELGLEAADCLRAKLGSRLKKASGHFDGLESKQ